MAGARIAVDDREVMAALRGLQRRGRDMRPLFQDLGEHLLNATRDRYDQQQSPDGQAWEPLKPRYRERKPRNKDKILVRDGNLRDTLRYQADAAQVEIGSDRIYAATHQFGDEERGIPARPFLGLSERDRADVLGIVEEYLLAG